MRKIFLIIVMILSAIMGRWIWHHFFKHKKDMAVLIVDVAQVKKQYFPHYLSASGTVKSLQSVDIVADVPAKISQIFFTSGQFVKTGDVVLIQHHEEIQAKIAEEVAKYAYLQKNLQRYVALARQGVISKDYLDNLQSQLNQEQAKLQNLNASLQKYIVRAPFSGKLGISHISLGQYLQPGEKVIHLQNDDSLVIDLVMPVHTSHEIIVGQRVGVGRVDDVCGVIAALDPLFDQQIHALTVRVSLKNCQSPIVVGATVPAFILTNPKQELAVPATAVHYSTQGSAVYRVKNQRAQLEPVEIEINQDRAILTKSHLAEGDWVISVGAEKVIDGQKIKIRERI